MRWHFCPWLLALLLLCAGTAGAQPFTDVLVQEPSLGRPERGSVAGSLASLSFAPASLLRGAFSLATALDAPDERGALLFDIFPTYSPESGLSEWGIGWQSQLAITRHRLVGEIDYQTDGYTSPWGRLVQDASGAWYPTGLQTPTRLWHAAGVWEAVEPDGTRLLFGQRQETSDGTFAWYLTQVETVLGDTMELIYATNASGRPFLTHVLYGARGHTQDYRLSFEYDWLAVPMTSYTIGSATVLDRRIRRVTIEVANATTRLYELRWYFDLTYQPAALGPAFFLESTQKVYRSGEAEPAVVYRYHSAASHLSNAAFTHLPELDAYLRDAGGSALGPMDVAYLDFLDDGLTSLEHAYAMTLVEQTPFGWQYDPLAPAPPDVDRWCRPPDSPYNTPRTLARMTPGVAEPHVVVTRHDAFGYTTTVKICSRVGSLLFEGQYTGRWQLGANTRLADLNRDHRPDMVAVYRSSGQLRYQVLENTSNAGLLGFALGPSGDLLLSSDLEPHGSWVHDVNGDRLADLVVLGLGGSAAVFYGRGHFRFTEGELLTLVDRHGSALLSLDNKGFFLIDANHDGLADVLLTDAGEARLFVNNGAVLGEVVVPALELLGGDMANPVVADLRGQGNAEVTYIRAQKAYSLALDAPQTGLLWQVDDGKGSLIELLYRRAEPQAGAGQRPAVLAELTVETSGYDLVTYAYDYDAAVLHSEGRFLVGYGTIRTSSPLLDVEVQLYNDDDTAGVLLSQQETDVRTPDLVRFEHRRYETRDSGGVRWQRPMDIYKGWQRPSTGEETGHLVEYLAYERERCATVVRTTTSHGVLLLETALDHVAGLVDAWHCLPYIETVTGSHPDAALDFVMQQEVVRNALGQVERVLQHGDATSLVVQELTYTPDHRVETLSRPGRGTTRVSYDPGTGLLAEIEMPDGVLVTAQQRDPVRDGLEELVTNRGAGALLTASFRFDGFERLARAWQDFGASSEQHPLVELSYQFPTLDGPGAIVSRELLDVASVSVRRSLELFTAAGEPYGEAARQPGGWHLSSLVQRSRTDLSEATYRRDPLLADSEILVPDYTTLLSGAVYLGQTEAAGFGYETRVHRVVQTGVNNVIETGRELVAATVVATSTENGDPLQQVRRGFDAGGRLLWYEDQREALTSFGYDALGRLVEVVLPDGSTHSVRYDDHGRTRTVERQGVGTISYSYDSTTGLLASQQVSGTGGMVERAVEYGYDAIGRIETQAHRLSASGQERVFRFTYDGQQSTPPVPGQLGFLTREEGEDYSRTDHYYRDGSLASSTWQLADWREVTLAWTYFEDGSPESLARTVRNLDSGAILEQVTHTYQVDGFGRLRSHQVNGTDLLTYYYDTHGLLDHVDVAEGQSIANSYDATTLAKSGYQQQAATWQGGVDWQLDNRGHIEREEIVLGTTVWQRAYSYDARGFLESSRDHETVASYSYSAAGLPESADDVAGYRTLARAGQTIEAGGVTYVYDHAGRVVQRGDLELVYGPDGHLAVARRHEGRIPNSQGNLLFVGIDGLVVVAPLPSEWRYSYDAAGQRLIKAEGGRPVAAYIAGGYLTDAGFIEPVTIDGRVVGILENGSLHLLATDPRSTLLAERTGQPRLPTPYGVRLQRPELAAAIDYVAKGYDADLGTVRFGVRDYDPYIGQWTTPDPLFLEEPTKGLESPVGLNLYSYAHNNPVAFVDPAGRDPLDWLTSSLAQSEGGAGGGLDDIPGEKVALADMPSSATQDRAAGVAAGLPVGSRQDAIATARKEAIGAGVAVTLYASMGAMVYLCGQNPSCAAALQRLSQVGVPRVTQAAPGVTSLASRLPFNAQMGIHAAQRMAGRGVTQKMVDMALRRGQTFWDPVNKTVQFIVRPTSGKNFSVSLNPATRLITTTQRQTKSLVRPRFIEMTREAVEEMLR